MLGRLWVGGLCEEPGHIKQPLRSVCVCVYVCVSHDKDIGVN